jgi:hypothetical protein
MDKRFGFGAHMVVSRKKHMKKEVVKHIVTPEPPVNSRVEPLETLL